MVAQRMMARCANRGADESEQWISEGALLSVGRFAWEMGPDFSDGVLVLDDGSAILAADASLYYREDLKKALVQAGVHPEGNSPSHLIAAAYRAWDVNLVDRLEGDFAFVLWDRRKQRLIAARDFAGSRPLY